MTTKQIIEVATKVANQFRQQSKAYEANEDLRNAITFQDREIGARTVINELLKNYAND
jgi:hypothetical protein